VRYHRLVNRILLLAVALVGIGMALIGPREPAAAVAAAAPDRTVAPAAAAPAASTVAFRPGEPSLVPGQAVTIPRGADGHFTAQAQVNGQAVAMMVDTGATNVALSTDDARRLGLPVDPASFAVVGTGASGPVVGQRVMLDGVAVGDRHVAGVEAVVVQGLDRSLLGQSYLRRLEQVAIAGDSMTLR
jgi:aspartyl protease family protein